MNKFTPDALGMYAMGGTPESLSDYYAKIPKADKLQWGISKLNLPRRVESILRKNGYRTLEDLTNVHKSQLLTIYGIGAKAIAQIVETLEVMGLELKEPIKRSRYIT